MEEQPPKERNGFHTDTPQNEQHASLTAKANVEVHDDFLPRAATSPIQTDDQHTCSHHQHADTKETDLDTLPSSEAATTSRVTFKVAQQDSNESVCDSGTSSMSLLPGQAAAGFEGEDMIDGPESEAFEIFRDYFPKLIEAMISEIETCAIHLYARRLINASVRDTAINPTIDSTLKAVRILQFIEHQIKQSGDNTVEKFVEVMKCCSQSIAGVGIEMSDALKRCNITDTPFSDGNSNSNVPIPDDRPQVRTQTSAPSSTGRSNHHEDYSSFYQKKYDSFPGAGEITSSELNTYNEEFDCARPRRTVSVCSTGEEDLLKLTDNLTNQLQGISQRHERRITKVLKEQEALRKELEFVKLKNQHLNQDLLQYRKCKAELEEYKKLAAQSANGCKSCQEKDKLLEMERTEFEARLENLNSQIGILLHQDSITSS